MDVKRHTPRRGRALGELNLTEEETRALLEGARSGKTAQAMALRARVVLACAQGLGNREVARQLGVTPQTVGKWRSRFLRRRLQGLLDDPRPGAPRRIDESTVEAIIARTLHDRPEHASRWSARAMARAMDLSGASVIRIWRAFGLRPRRHELEEFGEEAAQAADRLLDVAGVYVSSGIKAIVLCTLSPRHAPPQKEQSGSGTHAEEEDAHASLPTLAALEAATRQQGGSQQWRRGAQEFVHFLEQVDAIVPHELPLHVIMNSSGAHPQAVETWMRRHRRFRRYATPARAAWTAQIERWFRLLCRAGHARHSADELEAAMREYLEENKDEHVPFAWVRDQHRSAS